MRRFRMAGGPVVVTSDVLAGINAVRATGLVNMLQYKQVSMLAGACGSLAAGKWIIENPTTYTEGVIRGFRAEFNWNAPLIDEEAVEGFHHADGAGENDGDDDD